MRKRVGQRLDELLPDVPGTSGRAPGGAPQMGAHQRKGQLSRQEFVVGQPRPRQTFRRQVGGLRRPVQHPQRLGENRKALTRNPAWVLPLGQGPNPFERGVGCPADLIEAEPLGQRIYRLDQRQLRQIGLRDNTVGVHHLQHVVVEPDRARHVSTLPDRQQLLQVVLACIKECQNEIAGLIAGVDLIGRTWPVWWRRPVSIDGDRDSDDGVGHDVAQFWPRPAVDRPGREVKQKVDDTRLLLAAEQPAVELLELGSDAGERRNQGKKRIEQARPHEHPDFRAPMLARQQRIGNAVERSGAADLDRILDRSRQEPPSRRSFPRVRVAPARKPSQSKPITAPDIRLSSRYISVAGRLAGFGQPVSNDVARVADLALMTARREWRTGADVAAARRQAMRIR